ncbi:MAG: HAD family phosphatase [Mogibacterium sp.]|nr:HAD family phosphatase [Mogibacterium sp.]
MKKIIAIDLDDTLLDSNKELSAGNLAILKEAASAGVQIVPATGRFYKGIPEVIRDLPFINYAITVNGATVLNIHTGETLYEACIAPEEAVEIMEFLDTLPLIYDCYYDGWGYITASMMEQVPEFITSKALLKMMYDLRTPVDDLKSWIREGSRSPQKIMSFTRNSTEYRDEAIRIIADRFPGFRVTTSQPTNIEVNSPRADKGLALRSLAEALNVDMEDTAAIGDGLNDLSMIRMAGTGIAMANSCREVLEAADVITGDCDSDGAGEAIRKLI